MNRNVRTLISWWKVIGSSERDAFMKFFMFYICLDAWMTAESGKDRDDEKLNWLIHTDNDLRRHWEGIQSGAQFQSWLNGLLKVGRVNDMRPSQQGQTVVTLTDTSDFEQVIRFIYQIRCNLFHGAKSPVDLNDSNLVSCSAKILERWIEWTTAKSHLSHE